MQTSREVVDGLLRGNHAERIGLHDGIWGDTLRKWVEEEDPWAIEQHFLHMMKSKRPLASSKRAFEEQRALAQPFLPPDRRQEFLDRSVEMGFQEVAQYLSGTYC